MPASKGMKKLACPMCAKKFGKPKGGKAAPPKKSAY